MVGGVHPPPPLAPAVPYLQPVHTPQNAVLIMLSIDNHADGGPGAEDLFAHIYPVAEVVHSLLPPSRADVHAGYQDTNTRGEPQDFGATRIQSIQKSQLHQHSALSASAELSS